MPTPTMADRVTPRGNDFGVTTGLQLNRNQRTKTSEPYPGHDHLQKSLGRRRLDQAHRLDQGSCRIATASHPPNIYSPGLKSYFHPTKTSTATAENPADIFNTTATADNITTTATAENIYTATVTSDNITKTATAENTCKTTVTAENISANHNGHRRIYQNSQSPLQSPKRPPPKPVR